MFRNQFIEIAGLDSLGRLHGENKCRDIVRNSSHKWPPFVWLTEPREPRVPFTLKAGDHSFAQLIEIERMMLKQGWKPIFRAIYLGVVRARGKYTSRVPGFGPFSLFPVELEVYSVRNLSIVHKEPHDGSLIK
jgi:hypothetical protein